MEITKEQILEIMPNAKDVVGLYLPYINGYKEAFKIDTPLRMAHFLAQIAHESNELRNVKEIGSKSYFERYDTGKLKKMLGNLKPGDGYRYRGRGLIQITGRANYMAYKNSPRCQGDIITHPELLEKPLGAVKSAMWFWKEHGLNKLADKDSVLAVTRRINGGTNGLESRKNYLARAKEALNI